MTLSYRMGQKLSSKLLFISLSNIDGFYRLYLDMDKSLRLRPTFWVTLYILLFPPHSATGAK